MSSEEFWKSDPQLFVSYRTAFLNKKKRELEELDYACWLQGLYIHDGQGKLFLSLKQFLSNMIASMFKGKKDNTKIETYPELPYGEMKKKEQKKIEEKEKNYENYQNNFAYFGTLKQRYLEQMKNRQKKGE